MPKRITANTGQAPTVKQGHTTDGKHGSNPNLKVRGGQSVRELSGK